MKTSEQINEIAPALVLAQKNMRPAVKTADNPFFHSKYADLGSVMAACMPPLNEQGILVLQPTGVRDGFVGCETIFLHKSGQWISCELLLPAPKADPQAYGSCISYARRYCLAALAGISMLDDDAEGAMQRQEPAKSAPPKPKAKAAPVDPIDDAGIRQMEQCAGVVPADVETLGHIVMTFGSKHRGQEIHDIPLSDLEKAAVYDKLKKPADLFCQACIKKWVERAHEALASTN